MFHFACFVFVTWRSSCLPSSSVLTLIVGFWPTCQPMEQPLPSALFRFAGASWESTHAAVINDWMAGSELGGSEPHQEDDPRLGLSWNKRPMLIMMMMELVCVNQMVCEDVCSLCLSAHTETERVLPQWLTGIIAVSIFLFLAFVTFLVNRAWCRESSRSVRRSDVAALHRLKTKFSNKCLCVCVQQGDCRRIPERRPANVTHWAGNAQVAPRLRSSPSQTCHQTWTCVNRLQLNKHVCYRQKWASSC